MPFVAASIGSQGRLSLAVTGTAIASYTEAYDIVHESMKKRSHILDASGIRGTREHSQERTVQGIDEVGGQIVFEPGSPMLKLLLPRILGGALNSGSVPFAETLPQFDVLIDRIAKRYVYGVCAVDKATFSAKPGQKLQVALDIRGETETVNATAFPAISNPLEAPWVMSQGVITLNSVVRQITDFTCVVDNHLAVRYSNSQTATDISATDQTVSLTCIAPATTDNIDLYGQGVTSSAGTMVFTNGSNILTFTFAALQYEDESAVLANKGEVFQPIHATARKTGSTHALAFSIAP